MMTEKQWGEQLRNSTYAWATDAQWECINLLGDLEKGFHHFMAKPKPFGDGIQYNTMKSLATFDFNDLTRLVLLAHDRCIRAEICPSGPGRIKIVLHKREGRKGRMFERHPDIETAIKSWKGIR